MTPFNPRISSRFLTRAAAAAFVAVAAAGAPVLGQMPSSPGRPAQPGSARPGEKEKLKEEAREVLGPGKKRAAAEASAPAWSIVIAAYRGENPEAEAQVGLRRVQGEGGLPEAYLEKRGQTVVIAYGRYAGPADKKAGADLERIKKIEVAAEGQAVRPFEGAFLSPPAEIPGSIPEFDLRNAKRLHGEWVLYTLQIGVYSREDGKEATAEEMAEFRRTAEQAVVALRREGDPAYYYHGPRRSMVTVGLFGKDDFDPQAPGVESPLLRQLRKRYPHNLQNGMGVRRAVTIRDPRTGREVRREKIESSALVGVPE